ncbi:MAG: hypothetical protein K1X39_13150 [Thermoflexales bacterium]|nr:hypothetical protein [Thermoflexales bacterium]
MEEFGALVLGAVGLLNRIVVTGILITAFALIIYIGLYNRRSRIARAFAALLACVIAAFLMELLGQLAGAPMIFTWQRLQWVGIALIPAASLDLSDTLLRATGDISPTRRAGVWLGYLGGWLVIGLVQFTGLIAEPGVSVTHLPHLTPGPLFFPFAALYFACAAWATFNVVEARRRSLTSTSKRRMTYFALAFAAPMASMFPYLLPTGWPDVFPVIIPWLAILIANMGVGAAMTLMGYTVAFFGASAPDRVIKRRLVKYLIRGPLLAALVIAAIVISSRIERWLGVPGTLIGLMAAAAIVLLTQLFIVTLQPTLDRFIAGEDSAEVARLQTFSERLMTTSDLNQYLENILAALCDLLRARTAFVTMRDRPGDESSGAGPVVVTIGNVDPADIPTTPEALRKVASTAAGAAATSLDGVLVRPDPEEPAPPIIEGGFAQWNGYWLIPLRSRDNVDDVLGVIGLVARASAPELTREERAGMTVLVQQAARALDDAIKQKRAFEALTRIIPEAEDMQRRLSATRNPAAPTLADFEMTPKGYDDFTQLVRDALSQLWGGPKLSNSPLVNLKIVADAMAQNNGNATKALRSVLEDAIERLRPGGQRSLTGTEWLLYNILELKFVQGQKVRDVARKLVMSESDLYRKQRAAFEEVARVVMEMEREAHASAGTVTAEPAPVATPEAPPEQSQ